MHSNNDALSVALEVTEKLDKNCRKSKIYDTENKHAYVNKWQITSVVLHEQTPVFHITPNKEYE